jgi:hypothetical protein
MLTPMKEMTPENLQNNILATSAVAGRSRLGRPAEVQNARGTSLDTVVVRVIPLRSRKAVQRGLVGADAEGGCSVCHLRRGTGQGVQAAENPEASAGILGKRGCRRARPAPPKASSVGRRETCGPKTRWRTESATEQSIFGRVVVVRGRSPQ